MLRIACCVLISLFAVGSASADTNLAAGRPYTTTPAPNGYPDSGGELTNAAFGAEWPLDAWAGWYSGGAYAFDIVVDLGRDATLSSARLHTSSHTAWGIYYPAQIQVHVQRDGSGNWQPMGGAIGSPAQTSTYSTAWLTATTPVIGRHVRFRVSGLAGAHTFVDEFEVWGVTKNYDLSVGKFYTFSQAPNATYPDSYPVLTYSAGSELTNETLGVEWPLTEWVGWYSGSAGSVNVTVDLGKQRIIDQASIHCQSHTAWGIYYPTTVDVSTSTDGTNWTSRGSVSPPANTSTYSTAWLTKAFTATARYVRYTLNYAAAAHTQADEVQVLGQVTQTWKGVDPAGCYNGAYSTDDDGSWTMDLPRHEEQTGQGGNNKTLAMAMWYAHMNPDFAGAAASYAALQGLWNTTGGLGANGYSRRGFWRYLHVGWHPYTNPALPGDQAMTAAHIASGALDAYLRQWFLDSQADFQDPVSPRGVDQDYIWLRPMNEMNGGWTFPGGNELDWGGDPLNYRRAWRRMYNIAEKVIVSDNQLIFVFAPNGISYPDVLSGGGSNAPDQYYPGDQYVDWYGISVYGDSRNSPAPHDLPVAQIQGTVPVVAGRLAFNHQVAFGHKPMMIAEGGVASDYLDDQKRQDWVANWFTMKNVVPEMKAFIWFNPRQNGDPVLAKYRFENLSAAVQQIFRTNVADPYWLP